MTAFSVQRYIMDMAHKWVKNEFDVRGQLAEAHSPPSPWTAECAGGVVQHMAAETLDASGRTLQEVC
jgi:hypothetical protein